MKRAFLLSVVVLACACRDPNTPSDWAGDPTSLEEAKVACAAAKQKLDELHCRESRPDFVEFCVYEFTQDIPLHPQCIAKIATCADVEKC